MRSPSRSGEWWGPGNLTALWGKGEGKRNVVKASEDTMVSSQALYDHLDFDTLGVG